jgi:hypothetical protein
MNNNFKISRLKTDFGTFRVLGKYCVKRADIRNIDIQTLEMMGTDGRVLVNHTSAQSVSCIDKLLP